MVSEIPFGVTLFPVDLRLYSGTAVLFQAFCEPNSFFFSHVFRLCVNTPLGGGYSLTRVTKGLVYKTSASGWLSNACVSSQRYACMITPTQIRVIHTLKKTADCNLINSIKEVNSNFIKNHIANFP